MVRDGLLQPVGNGKWSLTEEGRAEAEAIRSSHGGGQRPSPDGYFGGPGAPGGRQIGVTPIDRAQKSA
jgi:hypothetical protein